MKQTLIALLALLTLVACTQEQRPLRFGVIRPSLNHLPMQVALAQGYLTSDDVELIELATGWETGEALAAGKLDMAILPFTYSWRNAAVGGEMRIVSFIERESDGLLARVGVDSLGALQGLRVGVLRASTLELLAEMTAADRSMSLEIVALRSPGEMLAALRSGEVDAISYYVPPILNESREPVLWFGELYPMHPCCDLSAHAAVCESRSEEMRHVMQALQQAIEWMELHPEETVALAADVFGLAPEVAQQALQHVHYRMGLDAEGQAFERRAAEMLYQKGEIERFEGFEAYAAPTVH